MSPCGTLSAPGLRCCPSPCCPHAFPGEAQLTQLVRKEQPAPVHCFSRAWGHGGTSFLCGAPTFLLGWQCRVRVRPLPVLVQVHGPLSTVKVWGEGSGEGGSSLAGMALGVCSRQGLASLMGPVWSLAQMCSLSLKDFLGLGQRGPSQDPREENVTRSAP